MGKGRKAITLTDQQIEFIESASGMGLTVQEMATLLGIAKKTFERLVNRDRKVKDALENGRNRARGQVKQRLFAMAVSGKNTAATIFWLKTQCGWRETQRLEHDVPEGGVLDEYLNMDPAQRKARIERFKKLLGY